MAQSFDKIVSSLFFKFQQKDCLPTMIRLFKQSFYDFFSKNKKESKKFSSYPNAGCFDEQIEYDYSPLHKCWPNTKVIHTKYSKHRPSTVAHTFECVCSKINHGLNHGLFILLLKLINCPIH